MRARCFSRIKGAFRHNRRSNYVRLVESTGKSITLVLYYIIRSALVLSCRFCFPLRLFSFFLEKSSCKIWWVFKKCVPLHSLSGKRRKRHDDRGAFGTAGVFFCPVSRSSSLTDWNKVRNKTRQRGGRNHLRQIKICQDKRNVNSATYILMYMCSDEIRYSIGRMD